MHSYASPVIVAIPHRVTFALRGFLTPTKTGAVNVNIDPASAIGEQTLKVKVVYGDEISEEKTYYFILEE